MHLSWSTSTTLPKSWTWLAPVGQQLTHGGRSQWLQRSEVIVSRRSGIVPSSRWLIQSRQKPSGTSFSVLQATTQSMQPTHWRVSMTIPKRAMVQAPCSMVTKLTLAPVPPISGSVA